ncbi:hypothetical protein QJS10_CPB20g00745 [Acorus calamus]|uniref:Uncharacterized protein n=1 Tax=Acorus calamus TaxID=4465 RepID=A0AAV9C9D7_ACOCL|nr:hypothetical protein QJS10_CPB20g00745 [Acorus calamus]
MEAEALELRGTGYTSSGGLDKLTDVLPLDFQITKRCGTHDRCYTEEVLMELYRYSDTTSLSSKLGSCLSKKMPWGPRHTRPRNSEQSPPILVAMEMGRAHRCCMAAPALRVVWAAHPRACTPTVHLGTYDTNRKGVVRTGP